MTPRQFYLQTISQFRPPRGGIVAPPRAGTRRGLGGIIGGARLLYRFARYRINGAADRAARRITFAVLGSAPAIYAASRAVIVGLILAAPPAALYLTARIVAHFAP